MNSALAIAFGIVLILFASLLGRVFGRILNRVDEIKKLLEKRQ